MTRADFTNKTKEIVAARSGYRCSFPECDRVTIGPGAGAHETTSIGVAAHIFAASLGGPRGTGGLTEEELTKLENAIWLCSIHATLVDNNRGDKYPPELLLSYKDLHEARIAQELQGLFTPASWIHELKIRNSPIFKSDTLIRFGKLNLVVGDNATGKSALCEWLAGFAEMEVLERWRNGADRGYPIEICMKYYNPDPRSLYMSIDKYGRIAYSEDRTPIPLNPVPIKFVYPRSRSVSDTPDFNDLQLFSYLLRLDESIIINLCKEVDLYEHATVKNIRFEEEEGILRMRADVSGTVPGLSFHALSAREQERVLIELATATARIYGKHVPTVLIFDASITIFFESWFEYYANHFSDPNSQFQTFVVIPTRKLDIRKLKWLGWEVIRTKDQIPDVTINQSIR